MMMPTTKISGNVIDILSDILKSAICAVMMMTMVMMMTTSVRGYDCSEHEAKEKLHRGRKLVWRDWGRLGRSWQDAK